MEARDAAIEALVASSAASVVAVACLRADGSPVVLREAERPFHAASTMKVPVLVEVHRAAAAGALDLDDPVPVRNAFRSIADGSPYALDPADDSETSLYGRVGATATVQELCRQMITVSSNLATNLLIERVGAGAVAATMGDLGLPGLVVRRGVEDDAAYALGLNNTVTARDLARLLLGIARREVVSPAASATMEALLAEQVFNEGIPAGLPLGTIVAHKTGSIPRLYHDAAIVRPTSGGLYVLVVLTTGLDEAAEAPALVASIAGACDASVAAGGAWRVS